MIRTLAALVVIALSAPALACPQARITNVAVTPTGTKLPAGGGVVFTAHANFSGPESTEEFRFNAGKKDVPVEPEFVAAGLYVMRPKARPGRQLDLVQGTTVVGHYAQAGRAAPIAPPAIAAVTSNATRPMDPPRVPGIPSTLTMIDLTAVPPANAYALVVYTMTSDGRIPRAWTPAIKDVTHYQIASGGKGCGGPAAAPTNQGDRIAFAWLDTTGRLSKLSPTITVGVSK